NVSDPAEKETFVVSPLLQTMGERKWLGQKTGPGFYKKGKGEKCSEILALDPETMEYRPRKKLRAPSLDAARRANSLPEKRQAPLYADDVAGPFAWEITKKTLLYSAARIPEIADDIVSVDRAMKWGFNWDLGPFEMWDAIGVEKSVARMREEGETIPPLVEELLASGAKSFYGEE